jgi:hypothetical protein
MKIDGNCIKCLASVLKQRHFHTNLYLTNSAANENFMYALELDVLPAKQQSVSEKMKKLEVQTTGSLGFLVDTNFMNFIKYNK